MSAPADSTGYRIVLPPGWLQVDVRAPDAVDRLERVLRDAVRDQPPDTVGPLPRRAREQAAVLVEQARDCGAVDLYAPLLGVRGRPVPASLVVHEVLLPEPPAGYDPVEGVLGALLRRHPDAVPVPVGGVHGLRWQVEQPASADGDRPAGVTAQVHVPVPGHPTRWLTLAFTAGRPAEHPELGEVLLQLFDAMLSTWRWEAGLAL